MALNRTLLSSIETETFSLQKSQKFTSEEYQEQIRNVNSPDEAKSMGYAKRTDFRKDWETVKLGIMEKALIAKFSQYSELKKILLETGSKTIEELSESDLYWGNGGKSGVGANHLGKLLMKVRDNLAKV